MNTKNATHTSDGMGRMQLAAKRMTDILLAAVGLVALLPAFILITLLLKILVKTVATLIQGKKI